jgi:hypothetical protein
MLALCNMRTIYVRNVPDEVVAQLEVLAARAKVSVNTLVLWELEAAAQRAANAELLANLPDLGLGLTDLTADRTGRPG